MDLLLSILLETWWNGMEKMDKQSSTNPNTHMTLPKKTMEIRSLQRTKLLIMLPTIMVMESVLIHSSEMKKFIWAQVSKHQRNLVLHS